MRLWGGLRVLHHAGGQPRGTARLAGGVDRAGHEAVDELQELGLGDRRVPHDAAVDVPAQADALSGRQGLGGRGGGHTDFGG